MPNAVREEWEELGGNIAPKVFHLAANEWAAEALLGPA